MVISPRISLALGYHPFSDKLDIEVEGVTKETFDDNIALSKNNKKRDLITDLGGALRLKYSGKRQAFDLTGRSTEHIYARNSSFTNNSQDVNFNYQLELTKKDRIVIQDTGSHYENPEGFDDSFGRGGGFYSTIQNRLSGDYTRDIAKQVQANAGYTNQFYIFTKSKGTRQNSYSNQARASGTYFWNSDTQFSLWYNFEDRSFEHQKETADINTILTGLKRYLTKQLAFDLQGGLDLTKMFDGTFSIGPVIYTALIGELNKRTQVNLSFTSRDRTSGYEVDVFQYWQISAGLTRELWKRLKTDLSAFYGQGKYKSMGITDHFFGWNATLDYEITQRIKAGLLYTFYDLSSSQGSRDYIRNQVTARVVLVF
jgi:hypothetical protein